MQHLIALDIGTTSCKAVAFDDQGGCFAGCNVPYPLNHPHPGWAEQQAPQIFTAVLSCLRKISRLTRAQGKPCGIVFSAAMHSLVAVDAAGNALNPLVIWADNRAADIAADLKSTRPDWYHRSGTPLHAMSVLPKMIWLRRHRPELFNSAHRFCGIKEYVLHRLTGQWTCDLSTASATGMMRLDAQCWDEEILQEACITTERLPLIVPPQHSAPLLAQTGLKDLAGVPVIAGASDGCCAAIGAEAGQPGDLSLTIGTSSALRALSSGIYTDSLMRTFCYSIDNQRFVIGGGANAGAYVLQWMKEHLFQYRGSLSRFYAEAEKIAPGSEGLLFFPWLMGERAPMWNAELRGALAGLGTQHTRAHMIRAAMEGVVFNLAGIGRALAEKTPPTRLTATGGFTQNQLWMQICADVFNVPLRYSPGLEVAAKGAAILAREALGLPPMPPVESWLYLQPDSAAAAVYRPMLEKFRALSAHY